MKEYKNLRDLSRHRKVGIDDVVSSYSKRISSHKAAWPNLVASKMRYLGLNVDVLEKKSDWNDYDAILIVLPMEFQGTFNVFGGANDELAERLQDFLDYDGTIYVADKRMPDIGDFIKGRKSACSDLFMKLDHDAFTEKCSKIDTVLTWMDSKTVVVGDSHSISVYVPGADIHRMDGKTLHGALKEGLWNWVPENAEKGIFYFGNIDIRHHLFRQDNIKDSVYLMLEHYEKQLKDLSLANITVVGALWIENEERKLPKTGYYKGTPFYGTQAQRASLVKWWNMYLKDMCKRNGWKFFAWPESMRNEAGELDFKYMEKPKSVHLSREFYLVDFETNKINENFKKLLN